jgi:uncharacterized protein (TIGR03435 family)
MPQLAKFMSDEYLHRPVLDETGLTAAFDYKSPPEDWETYKSDQVGSLLNLIREIGLKLATSVGPVGSFIIDQASRPSPN